VLWVCPIEKALSEAPFLSTVHKDCAKSILKEALLLNFYYAQHAEFAIRSGGSGAVSFLAASESESSSSSLSAANKYIALTSLEIRSTQRAGKEKQSAAKHPWFPIVWPAMQSGPFDVVASLTDRIGKLPMPIINAKTHAGREEKGISREEEGIVQT